MVAKITTPSSVRRALDYNEQKAKKGVAECLYAHGYLKEAKAMSVQEKLTRLVALTALNKRAQTNAVHVSLNFAPGENFDRSRLIEIASLYMGKIGLGDQPYLIYQHLDAGHPHLHIVSTNIQPDGRRISLHNIGRNQSAKARKELEEQFGLKKADGQKLGVVENPRPAAAQKVHYGKQPTKGAIAGVLDHVLPAYRYSSLPELNVVLKLYNVVADTGTEQSTLRARKGLVYRLLDENGNKIGVPVKASSIPGAPTLVNLEKRFAQNQPVKETMRASTKRKIDWVLRKGPQTLEAFQKALEDENIHLTIRKNEQGLVYGLTYINHTAKCVFNGSEIGKEYSAKAVLSGMKQPALDAGQTAKSKQVAEQMKEKNASTQPVHPTQTFASALDAIVSPVEQSDAVPYPLKRQQRKKRKPH